MEACEVSMACSQIDTESPAISTVDRLEKKISGIDSRPSSYVGSPLSSLPCYVSKMGGSAVCFIAEHPLPKLCEQKPGLTLKPMGKFSLGVLV